MQESVYWGVSFGHHDAAISVVKNNKLVYASHAERYSKVKNDKNLNDCQLKEALAFGHPCKVLYYENPKTKLLRKILSGQFKNFFSSPKKEFSRKFKSINDCKAKKTVFKTGNHHRSHAALGYYTSGFNNALIITCDAIGEFETLTVYKAQNNQLKKKPLYSLTYPDSLGLFFSAITKAIGLKANEEEFITMGMSSYGKNIKKKELAGMIEINRENFPKWKNLQDFHLGIDLGQLDFQDKADWAATAQLAIEEYILEIYKYLLKIYPHNKNWVFSGGMALNCKLNSKIASSLPDDHKFSIFPNPGDAGSSLGAILAYTNQHIVFKSPYLGTKLTTKIRAQEIVQQILKDGIVGLVQAEAEFGPRALGNRSLLADPRKEEMKEKVNQIKKREEYRPFAPVIPLELAHDYFEFPNIITESPYMQFLARVKYPEKMMAIKHVDNTARVQTLHKIMNPLLHEVLIEWREQTDCPVLLNTSLNIKGQPLVNNLVDAREFQDKYNIKIFGLDNL